jgi:hypothetical protein
MTSVILLVDILIAVAVVKLCRVLGCCEEPGTPYYHSVEGNTMKSKMGDVALIP